MQQSSSEGNAGMVNKMGIWLLMITITILFGSLGLGYMLTTSPDAPLQLPWMFYVNTGILIGSSFFLHFAWINRIKKGKTIMLPASIGLGIVFLLSQIFTWYQLYAAGLSINEGGRKISYLYVLTGLHAAHIIGGILFLAYVSLRYSGKGRRYFETAVFFWHFLGILWLYLLLIMVLN